MFHATETHHCQRDTSVRRRSNGSFWRTSWRRTPLLPVIIGGVCASGKQVIRSAAKTLASRTSLLSSLRGDAVR